VSQRAFTIADTHFFHEKALKFRAEMGWQTVWAMNEEMIYRWNHTVRPQDTVVHLGDVALCSGNPEYLDALPGVLERLNGRKLLVMGNHDTMKIAGKHFDIVYGVKERKNCILTHIPVSKAQCDRFRLNIHGHLHNDVVETSTYLPVVDTCQRSVEPVVNWEKKTYPDPWYYCVSVEQTNYAPIPFADIIQERFHSE